MHEVALASTNLHQLSEDIHLGHHPSKHFFLDSFTLGHDLQ